MINISQSIATAARLEAALDKLEAAIAARDEERARAARIETAAREALATLDSLLDAD